MTETMPRSKDRTWPVMCHLSSFAGLVLPAAGNWLGPLVVWLAGRGDDPEVEAHGREAVNFNLSILLWYALSALLCLVLVGFILLPAVYLLHLVCTFIASMRAGDGRFYRYPLTIRFL